MRAGTPRTVRIPPTPPSPVDILSSVLAPRRDLDLHPQQAVADLVAAFSRALSRDQKESLSSLPQDSFEAAIEAWLYEREQVPIGLVDPYRPDIEIKAGQPLPDNSTLIYHLREAFDKRQAGSRKAV